MEYTILILLLPFLSFLALGLGGKWMSHRTAGLIGTAALGVVQCFPISPQECTSALPALPMVRTRR